jgi:uncharacterized protein (DUF1800 family)
MKHTEQLSTATLAAAASAALAACGGGSDAPSTSSIDQSGQASAAALPAGKPPLKDAWRFLNQATMGPKAEEVDWVAQNGYEAWLSKQFAYATPTSNHVKIYRDNAEQYHRTPDNKPGSDIRFVYWAWWRHALMCPDQLRIRVTNALAEILVVSLRDNSVGWYSLAGASYLDKLAENAFGNFRTLIETMIRYPAMGFYLSYLRNQPPDASTGRIPDQNFARELLQLFTLGLNKLNMDGTVVKDANGRIVPTSATGKTDVVVLSNVFTGWFFDNDPGLADIKTEGVDDKISGFFDGGVQVRNSKYLDLPMKGYADHHSTKAQVIQQISATAGTDVPFLDKTLAWGSTPEANMKAALDIIFQHQNLAPFIAKQMIQRLVTSNPGPLYVQRVATAFKNSNWGMQALIRAILLDDEARNTTKAEASTTYGKLREPLMRVTHLFRAFNATATAVRLEIDGTSDVSGPPEARQYYLNQSPLSSPTVFNFFSPSYQYPSGAMAPLNKVAPEMQLASEAAVIAYINAVGRLIEEGIGSQWDKYTAWKKIMPDLTAEVALAAWPDSPTTAQKAAAADAVASAINRKLFGGGMSAPLKDYLISVLTGAGAPASALARVQTALLLAAVSSEYLVQK